MQQVFKGGNYSREETIVFFFIYEIHTYEKRSINIAYFLQFRSSKLIFFVKRQLKLENLVQKVPHVAFWLFCDNICSNFQVLKGGKFFKWGNYSGEETIQGRKLLIIRSFWLRKLFKGGKYSREETIWGNSVFSSTEWISDSCYTKTADNFGYLNWNMLLGNPQQPSKCSKDHFNWC